MRLNRPLVVGFLFLVVLPVMPCAACFSVVVGKDASTDGAVLVGHNEDDGGPQVVNHYKVPRRSYAAGEYILLRNGGQLQQVEETWAYLWSELPGMSFSDSFVNEWGVCVTSDNCPSREDRPEITEGGINAQLRHLIAQRARSAREGVQLAGQLIERFGYTASGRTYIISDPQEGWIFCAVQGKHWLARRVPDDEVAFVANTYTVRQVDLSDTTHVLASEDIVSYAIKRGWYDPAQQGAFDFAAVYADAGAASHPGNSGRQRMGLNYVTSAPIPPGVELPFAVKPKHRLGVSDVVRILRHKGALTPNCIRRSTESNAAANCSICRGSTQTSFVAQLRRALPREIGLVYWMCLSQPETSVYIPYHWGIASFPFGFSSMSERPTRRTYDKLIHAPFQADPAQAFWTFANFRHKVERLSPEARAQIQAKAQRLEVQALSMQDALEAATRELYTKNQAGATVLLTNYSKGLYLSALEMMSQIISKRSDD